jgi:hypothetical protein
MTHLSQFMNSAIDLKLSVSNTMAVMDDIIDTMNGDGLYEDSEVEVILEAFYNQECSDTFGYTWADHISDILERLQRDVPPPEPSYTSTRLVCQNTVGC